MSFIIDPTIHMWVAMLLTGLAVFLFAQEKWSLELTSIAILTVLVVFGQIFPLLDANGRNQLDTVTLFSGFANPSLIAVLALLVMGQGIIQTDALNGFSRFFTPKHKGIAWLSYLFMLIFVMGMSAFMNNTPLVVLAIPIMQLLASSMGVSESRVLMPLSFVAIMGGMTTLVGSSTNLLVSSTMQELGYEPLGFFDFFIPGAMMAGIGFVYILAVSPFLLPDRSRMAQDLVENEKEFIAEIDVSDDSELIGIKFEDGRIPLLPDLKVRLAQRMGQLTLPPFDDYIVQKGDVLIVSATRQILMDIFTKHPGVLLTEEKHKTADFEPEKQGEKSGETSSSNISGVTTSLQSLTPSPISSASKAADQKQVIKTEGLSNEAAAATSKEKASHDSAAASSDQSQQNATNVADTKKTRRGMLAEIMITPGSRLIDMSMEQAGFDRRFGIMVMGIQRRARVVRRRLGRIRLEAGDVLLVAGNYASIQRMRASQDLIVLSGSKREVPKTAKAPLALMIFLGVIGLAASGVISIPAAAFTGAVIMIATSCLNIRQATRAIDRKIFLLVGSMLALGTVLQITGGALFIAQSIMTLPFVADSPLLLSALLFLMVAITTNVLTNNACAILFTPIALNMAISSQIDPIFFAITVVLAANCSFASPIGYQTNLLVMGPGHYRFRDFLKVGVPLMLILWVSYIIIAKFYYGI